MSAIKDGGPAFPIPLQSGRSWQGMAPCDGMTLRDYFAGKALSGMLSDPNFDKSPEDTASLVYRVADAMLACREKGGA